MEEPIRVLHILQRMEAGGTQALLMNLYRNIDRKKVQFDFLVEYSEKQFYDDEILSLGGRIYYTNVRRDYNILKFTKYLKEVIRNNHYKIVHMHTYSIGYFCLKAAKKCQVPTRIAHSHSNSMTKDSKQYIKKILKRLYTKYATDLLACSKEAGEFLYGDKKFSILTNAIQTSKFSNNIVNRKKLIEEAGMQDKFVVGHVGRFRPEKNHKFLLEVFKEIKKQKENAILLMVGDGELEKDIVEELKNSGMEKDFIIMKNKRDMENVYQLMDIMIFPSLYEGLGIATIEAQASGIPVLCSNRIPSESKVSTIYEALSLEIPVKEWANKAIELSKNPLAHTNIEKNVIDAGFDITDIAKKMEKFYLNKYEQS